MLSKELLLTSPTARRLYHAYAENAPIYDYHCHLSAQDILDDHVFADISDLWLKYDHYKWRAMRIAGLAEDLITGQASSLDKFRAFAKTVARLVGSPLYHWVYLELKEYFGITEQLSEDSADRIYETCNRLIRERQLRPSDLIAQSRVKLIGTTDDPTDLLTAHLTMQRQAQENDQLARTRDVLVVPTFRPDRILNLNVMDYPAYLDLLAKRAEIATICDYQTLLEAIANRIAYFDQAGCLMSDHSLEKLDLPTSSREQADAIFKKRLNGTILTAEEIALFRSQVLSDLAKHYHEHKWIMQLHIGALRNNNPSQFAKLGADAGYDIMNDFPIAEPLAGFLSRLASAQSLPATILYSLNSKDNLVLSSLPHCFADGITPGKVQFGSAWWFNDTQDGMYEHIKSIAAQSMLPWFVGMLTDSRSFLSYTRHDYFRRVLCKFIGEQIDRGEFAATENIYQEIIEGVCFGNIQRYLRLE
ncbi:MAG: glucuronate isomerase [Eubacteriales bacterium]|nr:glucuronate isomerase [Eubacteriales bacterium]